MYKPPKRMKEVTCTSDKIMVVDKSCLGESASAVSYFFKYKRINHAIKNKITTRGCVTSSASAKAKRVSQVRNKKLVIGGNRKVLSLWIEGLSQKSVILSCSS